MMEVIRVPMMQIGDVMIYDSRDFVTLYPEKLVPQHTHFNERVNDTIVGVVWHYVVVIYVPRGVKVTTPIQLQDIVSHTALFGAERITIIVEENAQVIIHDMPPVNVSSDNVTRSIEVIVSDYAQVTFVTLQDRLASINEFSTLCFYVGNHSVVNYASLMTGSYESTSWLEVIMKGEYAQVNLNGVWLLDGNRTIDMTTMQRHLGAHNTSKLRIKSAVRDNARSVYRGTVHVAVDARGTYAAQENKNILLSENASAYSIPNLEALNNDIYCAHGTAVGQLDEEQLLYMQARGIAYKQAQRMLLQGFLADAIPDYLSKSVHEAYTACIIQWLDS